MSDEHREDEEVQVREEPPVALVLLHVLGRVEVDEEADAGDDEHHHAGERVDAERRASIGIARVADAARAHPLPGGPRELRVTVLEPRARRRRAPRPSRWSWSRDAPSSAMNVAMAAAKLAPMAARAIRRTASLPRRLPKTPLTNAPSSGSARTTAMSEKSFAGKSERKAFIGRSVSSSSGGRLRPSGRCVGRGRATARWRDRRRPRPPRRR